MARRYRYIEKKDVGEVWVIVAFGFLVALLGLVAIMANQGMHPFWKGFLFTPLVVLILLCVVLLVIGDDMLCEKYRFKVEVVK